MASLSRPRNGRVIAGVCAAIGNRFGMSPLLVRTIFLVSLLLPGPQFLIYIAGWILIPDEKRF
jgi:phage shock protein PspC (stress-responsive transcriptional regulator)